MPAFYWERYPTVAQSPNSRSWLQLQLNLGLAANTIAAYGRTLEDFLHFCGSHSIMAESATRAHISEYVRELTDRPPRRTGTTPARETRIGLANATIQQRLTAIRLWYDYLIEEGLRTDHPVGKGHYTPGKNFGGKYDNGLVPREHTLPWIPNEDQWQTVLVAAKGEPLRNRLMLAFAYDAGLRRAELCALETTDIDPAHRLIRVRSATTKNRLERMVPYSEATSLLYAAYLQERRLLSRARGPLFLSASDRNLAQPISIWTWSKVVERLAERSTVSRFTTHTPRHLCLTDLARSGWDIHEIALFAGHRSIQTTLLYLHLSGRELGVKIERGMAAIHTWRIQRLAEVLQ